MKIKEIFKKQFIGEEITKKENSQDFYLFYKLTEDVNNLKESVIKIQEPENLDLDIIFQYILSNIGKNSIKEEDEENTVSNPEVNQEKTEQKPTTLNDISGNLFAISKIFPKANNFIISISNNTNKVKQKTNIKGDVGFWLKSRLNPQTSSQEINISNIQNGLKETSNMEFTNDVNKINSLLTTAIQNIGDYVNKLLNK